MSETTEKVRKTLARRYRSEKRFKAFGIGAIGIGLMALVLLFTDIIGKGHSAFFEHEIQLPITFDAEVLDVSDPRDEEQLNYGNYQGVIRNALAERFPTVEGRQDTRALNQLVSTGAVMPCATCCVRSLPCSDKPAPCGCWPMMMWTCFSRPTKSSAKTVA